ncbi:MAG: DUF4367 domain-containing protein [Bacillota bacterium]|nr:DUF4367 domain-containing protein [Bacillota bacterium]MDW7683668.1 DUF4367 domain-containing protein [Bacillota bacterium]
MRETGSRTFLRSRAACLLVLALLLSVLAAGCSMSEERLQKKAAKTMAKMKGYYAELDAVVFSPEDEQNYSVRQWLQNPDRWRVEVTTEAGGQFFICDGEQVFIYQPGFDDYYRLAGDATEELSPPFMLTGYLEAYLRAKTHSFGGLRTAGDESYYFVTYKTQGRNESVHLWLDKKTLFPMIVETYLDESLLNRLSCTLLQPGVDFADDIFEYQPPDEGEVASLCLIRPLSLDDAQQDWPYPVYVPEYVPQGCFLFVISQSEEADQEQLIFIYKGDQHFTFVQRPKTETEAYRAESSRQLIIGEMTGFYHENLSDELATLYWSDNTMEFILTGSLTMEEMVRIAASVKAQGSS